MEITKRLIEELRELLNKAQTFKTISVPLSAGTEIVLCPWHQEKTPSLCVNKRTGEVFCFGCGRSATYEEYTKAI